MIKNLCGVLLLLLTIAGCSYLQSKKNNEPPLARINDSYLYPSDIAGISEGMRGMEDSAETVKKYIERWIKDRLLLGTAQKNAENKKQIDKQTEEYKNALLLHCYKQSLIDSELDTVIEYQEVLNYYKSNTQNFILNAPAVRALLIKIPVASDNIRYIRNMVYTTPEDKVDQLKEYALFAPIVNDTVKQWVMFNAIDDSLPKKTNDVINFLNYMKISETADDNYRYMLKIFEMRLPGEVSPLFLVEDKIKSIIINQRKINLLTETEDNLYNRSLNQGDCQIY